MKRTRAALASMVALATLFGCNADTDENTDETTAAAPTTAAVVDDVEPQVDGLVLDVDVTGSPADVVRATMSDDQASMFDRLGAPDRFVLRFDDGSRHEVWHHDQAGVEVVFRDGGRLYVEAVRPLTVVGLGTTSYTPDQFSGGMSLDDLLVVTGERGYAEQPLDLVGGRLIVVRGVVAAFDDDGLRYLETVPIDLE